ncbi:HGV2 protein isoform X1 [Salmo salar]|uniref:HGV2 n=1 Tax=Salmo salar TaxID=8030 RepID=C0HD91_SALSA|nr:HGV2 protein [Salmo salar]XP_013996145.1 HGV2 protein isoform X1 [Salmo salar]ACN12657.1 HGV2 [Salmo salar]|eukprot:NP_001167378.1 HGV2 protein [Salmo salar]
MVMEEANKLIGTGKRHLVMGDVVSAVNYLQEACGMLAKRYGDTADECGEAFFLCGKALLELARMENGVLGNALTGVPEEEEGEEEKPKDSNIESTDNVDEKTRDELRVQVYDAMAEEEKNGEKADSDKNTVEETGGGEEGQTVNGRVNGSDTTNGEEKVIGEKGDKAETKESSDNPEEEDGDVEDGEEKEDIPEDSDDEEVGNLQLAWEMLEVAKVIYKRKEGKEDQLLAAQAHLNLGEVAAESGNYSQAVDDFQQCLSLQLKHLASDSRLLAETHYQLGLTLCSDCQYSQAIEHFNHSARVIKSRLAKLQEVLEKAEGPEVAPEERKEMEELKALLPEIQEKVEDATVGQKITAAVAAEAVMQETLAGGSAFPTPSGSSQNEGASASVIQVRSTYGNAPSKSPASDISHLVRKKRKPGDSPVKENDSKKVKQETQVNSNRDNGVKDKMEVERQ